ncbi:MAG: hypothetical protein Rubg2KO_40950 [Rubricoccaceae bacterium]
MNPELITRMHARAGFLLGPVSGDDEHREALDEFMEASIRAGRPINERLLTAEDDDAFVFLLDELLEQGMLELALGHIGAVVEDENVRPHVELEFETLELNEEALTPVTAGAREHVMHAVVSQLQGLTFLSQLEGLELAGQAEMQADQECQDPMSFLYNMPPVLAQLILQTARGRLAGIAFNAAFHCDSPEAHQVRVAKCWSEGEAAFLRLLAAVVPPELAARIVTEGRLDGHRLFREYAEQAAAQDWSEQPNPTAAELGIE